jgi:hypothetical protein
MIKVMVYSARQQQTAAASCSCHHSNSLCFFVTLAEAAIEAQREPNGLSKHICQRLPPNTMLETAFELHCSAGEGLSLHGSCVPNTRKWTAWRGKIADQYLNFHQQFACGV